MDIAAGIVDNELVMDEELELIVEDVAEVMVLMAGIAIKAGEAIEA